MQGLSLLSRSTILMRIAAGAAAMAALLVWRVTYGAHCVAALIPCAVIFLIAYQSVEFGLAKRRCLANCFLPPATMIHRLATGRVVAFAVAIAGSLIAGGLLILNLVLWRPPVLALLAVDAALIALVLPGIERAFARGLRSEMVGIAAKHALTIANGLVLLVLLVVVELHAPIPVARDVTWQEALRAATQAVGSDCPQIDVLVRLYAEKEAMTWWLMLSADTAVASSTFRFAAWFLFLLSSSLSVWAFSRFVVQAVHLARVGGAGTPAGRSDDPIA